MRGAFIVGALKKIHETLGPDYFDAIFATSVGVFEQAFFASGQIFFMENTWREYVHGFKLINLLNPLRGRAILDLDYLTELFQSDESRLDVEAMKNSRYKLVSFISTYDTRETVAVDLKDHDVFSVMMATCALPFVYPKKIYIKGRRYIDSIRAPRKQFQNVLKESLEGYDEVVAITTKESYDQVLGDIPDFIIKPTHMPLWASFDTNQKRLIATIKQGEDDAEKFTNTVV